MEALFCDFKKNTSGISSSRTHWVFYIDAFALGHWTQIRDPCTNSRGHKYLTSFGLGWTFRMRYFASLLFRQLKVAPRRPPTIPIRMKKPKSTAVQRWHFLSDSEHYMQKSIRKSIKVVAAISYQCFCLQSRTVSAAMTKGEQLCLRLSKYCS